MQALSFAIGDDQQSAILAFAWNGGIVSSTNHFNIVHRCLNSGDRKYQQAYELYFIVNKSIERGEE
ncbi:MULTISPECIES: hypothetical protein [unclassified Bartonella]|uniref:hypothetical protein n=1 Tax=unclassified Bartonella TaxID=2645622 RepID=UPI0035D11F06